MRLSYSLLVIFTLCVASTAHGGNTIDEVEDGISLREAYGEVEAVHHMKSWEDRGISGLRLTRSIHPEEYYARRTPGNCTFPLEVMILQDATDSFHDDYENMKNTQLDLMFREMAKWHPNTTYGVGSFHDIPKWPLGDPAGDYCHRFEQILTDDFRKIREVYNRLESNGGADTNEGQFLAIIATAQSEQSGWRDPLATRVILLITDSAPHFDLDGFNKPEYEFLPFSGRYDEEDPGRQCICEYYPSPNDVKRALFNREAYLAMLIFGGDYQNGLPWKNWEWINGFLGQTPGFLSPIAGDSSNFWKQLSFIIREIEKNECGHSPAVLSSAMTNMITSAAETDTSTDAGEPASTSLTTTTSISVEYEPTSATATATADVQDGGDCKCSEGTKCQCPAVVIELHDKPAKLSLEVESF